MLSGSTLAYSPVLPRAWSGSGISGGNAIVEPGDCHPVIAGVTRAGNDRPLVLWLGLGCAFRSPEFQPHR